MFFVTGNTNVDIILYNSIHNSRLEGLCTVILKSSTHNDTIADLPDNTEHNMTVGLQSERRS